MRTYPKYKASSIPWLDKIPSHWRLLPSRAIVENQVQKNDGAEIQEYLSLMANIGIIRYEDKGDVGNKKPDDLAKCKIVRRGNLVINSMNYAIGSYGMSPYDGVCSPVYIVLEPNENIIERRFALRLFENKPMQKHLALFGNGILEHRAAIKWDDIKSQHVPVPPMDEQKAILEFLDRETARIDNLIAEKQNFINLLKEKRQALISHVVTKGLDPNVKMKDSGIEWIGEVPEHWELKSYRYACKIYRGKFSHRPRNDPALYNGDYAFIQTGDVARAKRTINNYKQTLNEEGIKVSQKFPAGTLVMAIAANIGVTAILGFEAYAPDSIVGFNPKDNIDLDFLRFSFNAALPALEQASTQSTQANLNIDRIAALKAAFPPLNEQKKIVKLLDTQTILIENIMNEVKISIELLKEHRIALISTAVTGKIDVRSEAQTSSEHPHTQESTYA